MPLIDTNNLKPVERLPGWEGRYLHTERMTVAQYDFTRGAVIHEHAHPSEEIYDILSGKVEIVIDGVRHIARPGLVAVAPRHAYEAARMETMLSEIESTADTIQPALVTTGDGDCLLWAVPGPAA